MLNEKLTEFIFGKIYFEAENGFFDNFLKECRVKNIPLYDIKILPEKIFAFTLGNRLKDVNTVAKHCGMTVNILKNSGLPHFIGKIKLRLGVPAGLVAFLIVFTVLSQTVWSVEITGCKNIDAELIASVLEAEGIKRGAFIHNIDCNSAEDALEAFDELIYKSAVDIRGCRVFADIVENSELEKISSGKAYSNIIASQSGEIIKANIFSGEGKISPGDIVVKGDLLVSGITELKTGEFSLNDSSAQITAKTERFITCSISDSPDIMKITKTKKFSSLYFFGLTFPLRKSNYEGRVSADEKFISTKNTVFPVGVIRFAENFFDKNCTDFSLRQKELICLYDLSNAVFEQLGENIILSREININHSDTYFIEAHFSVEENITKKVYLNADTEDNQ